MYSDDRKPGVENYMSPNSHGYGYRRRVSYVKPWLGTFSTYTFSLQLRKLSRLMVWGPEHEHKADFFNSDLGAIVALTLYLIHLDRIIYRKVHGAQRLH